MSIAIVREGVTVEDIRRALREAPLVAAIGWATAHHQARLGALQRQTPLPTCLLPRPVLGEQMGCFMSILEICDPVAR